MKKYSKIIIVILFLLITTGCPWSPQSDEPKEYHYTINDVEALNIDNSGKRIFIVKKENTIIPKEGYGIRIIFDLKLTDSIINDTTASSNFTKNISFFNKLYAIDPPPVDPPMFILIDTIISIKVFTLNNFDNVYYANSEVTDLFEIYEYSKYITIDEYIKKWSGTLYLYYNYNAEENKKEIIDLHLMKFPTFAGEHSFRVEVLLSDGRILSATTIKIKLE